MPELEQHHDETAAAAPDLALRRAVVAEVNEVPGVARIEPGLAGAIRSWLSAAPEHEIGVTLRDRRASVTVNVAIRAGYRARDVARDVHERLAAVVQEQGLAPGDLEVSVLTIEPAQPPRGE
ncbi:Asp23/Gls24 family envelope stress response protein [Bogoriella caseilytica]|uniref:Cell envelope-related Asp23 family protein n=1 Tax=Bogoriella caseilytica TaxID=56055 RepID=A0A3N2BE27_9MICO|nr:Asp23/Gls24 family envelope stress response protein [Bogoriella caseilytica]ROR73498.1 cell envelope-related Asp23 family protein [Bogoriella caseilytica]